MPILHQTSKLSTPYIHRLPQCHRDSTSRYTFLLGRFILDEDPHPVKLCTLGKLHPYEPYAGLSRLLMISLAISLIRFRSLRITCRIHWRTSYAMTTFDYSCILLRRRRSSLLPVLLAITRCSHDSIILLVMNLSIFTPPNFGIL